VGNAGATFLGDSFDDSIEHPFHSDLKLRNRGEWSVGKKGTFVLSGGERRKGGRDAQQGTGGLLTSYLSVAASPHPRHGVDGIAMPINICGSCISRSTNVPSSVGGLSGAFFKNTGPSPDKVISSNGAVGR